jgi:hypothetical protein
MPGMYSRPLLFWSVLLFLGCCLGILSIWTAARRLKTGESIRDILMLTGAFYLTPIRNLAVIISTTQTIKFMLAFALGILAGWKANDIWQRSAADVITNIHFLRQEAPDKWHVETTSHSDYTLKFCPAYLPQIDAGSTAEFMKFHQKPDCIDVSGPHHGFKFYRHPNGEPIIEEGSIYGTRAREEASAARGGRSGAATAGRYAAATAP